MSDFVAPNSGGSKRKASDEPEEKKETSRRRIEEINRELILALKDAEREIRFLTMSIQIENLKRRAMAMRASLQKKQHIKQMR